MRMRRAIGRAGLLAVFALGLGVPAAADIAEITGTVNWTDGTRVPPGAHVTVRLVDVGAAPDPVELATILLEPGEKAPLVFRMTYDTALIASQGSYRLTATMAVGKLALMQSLRATPVLTVGGTADPEILLERVVIAGAGTGASPFGREWLVRSILDEPVTGAVRLSLVLGEDGTASGSTGCNDFRGSIETSPEVLTFGPLLTTRRGCSTPIRTIEKRALRAFRDVRGWRINGDELLLTDAVGTVMMRLTEGR